MKLKSRQFETTKSEKKLNVISSWKSGKSISEIAKEHALSRPTIYRWLELADQKFACDSQRKRIVVDESVRFMIIEAFVLLGAPSMRRLSEALQNIYFIHLSPSQLRRYLQKWNLFEYKTSRVFKSLLRYQAQPKSDLKKKVDGTRAEGSSHKSFEHSEREDSEDLYTS